MQGPFSLAKQGVGRVVAASPLDARPVRFAGACLISVVVAGHVAVQPAHCEPLHDGASGLTIVPPAGYSANRMAPSATFTGRFEVKTAADHDTGCQVAFSPLPENAGHSQEELNRIIDAPQWRDLARAGLTLNYSILDVAPFANGAAHGAVLTGDIRQRPGYPARSQDVRTLFFIVETPKGRTTTVCVGEKAGFDARRAEFEAVARGVTPP